MELSLQPQRFSWCNSHPTEIFCSGRAVYILQIHNRLPGSEGNGIGHAQSLDSLKESFQGAQNAKQGNYCALKFGGVEFEGSPVSCNSKPETVTGTTVIGPP